MSSRTVFIADSQPPYRAGLRSVLEAAGLDVLGEADDALDALDEIAELRPAICLIDSNIRGGIVAVSRITQRVDAPAVLVLASALSHDGLLAALRAGASGYLPRSTPGRGLVRAVESVLDGNFAVTRSSVSALIHEVRGGGRQAASRRDRREGRETGPGAAAPARSHRLTAARVVTPSARRPRGPD